MRALIVHNHYQIRGGEDEVFAAEVALLKQHDHDVAVYSTTNDRVAEMKSWEAGLETIWSNHSYQAIQQTLRQQPYDVLHAHNTFPLISPAAYYAARSLGVPVVQTLHNYRLLCANALFFRDGQVCEQCLDQPLPIAGIKYGCYRESKAASAAVVAMLAWHRLRHTWNEQVDCYIALTEFARQKFIAGGLPADKIKVKPNFVDPDPGMGDGNGQFFLFVGRLSTEKGLDILLDAWKMLDYPYKLKIIGEGPLAPLVEAACAQSDQIEWLGRQPLETVYDLMGQATGLIFPSKWYEPFGRVATEAFARGTPVIASAIGAIAEIVADRVTGLHFRPSDASDLARAVTEFLQLLPQPEFQQMRQAARTEFLTKYTATQNHAQLLSIYAQAQTNRQAAP
jgi:glycosyltransferase involved in cell wall biosynthesis